MEVVLEELANDAMKKYPQTDKDTMSGLFLKEEEHAAAAAVGGAGGGSIVGSTIMVNTNHDTPSLSNCTTNKVIVQILHHQVRRH